MLTCAAFVRTKELPDIAGITVCLSRFGIWGHRAIHVDGTYCVIYGWRGFSYACIGVELYDTGRFVLFLVG